MIITRQRAGTAKGFVFLTLQDEAGLVNVIVNPPSTNATAASSESRPR